LSILLFNKLQFKDLTFTHKFIPAFLMLYYFFIKYPDNEIIQQITVRKTSHSRNGFSQNAGRTSGTEREVPVAYPSILGMVKKAAKARTVIPPGMIIHLEIFLCLSNMKISVNNKTASNPLRKNVRATGT